MLKMNLFLNTRITLIIGISCFVHATGFSQQTFKFGKYDLEEIELVNCYYEPDADEVILFHVGISSFANNSLQTYHHLRKKILKEEGKDKANVILRFYHGDDAIESIKIDKAQLVNFENGKEVIYKLSKNEIFEANLPNGYKEIRMAFPNTKEGSIIEYTYEKTDKYLTFIDGWSFQSTSPTLYSRYTIGIPEGMNYNMLTQGAKLTQLRPKPTSNGYYYWELNDLHSIKPEPFLSNAVDYVEKIEFQLSNYQTLSNPGYGARTQELVNVLHTWEKAGDEIRSTSNFNTYLKTKKGQAVIPGVPLDDLKSIYSYVQNNFVATSKNGILPSKTQKDLINSGSGSKADINLLLLSILQSNDIEAYPVLISSKGNGRSNLVKYPFISQFNQLIIKVIINNEPIFLDASEPNLKIGYLSLDNHVNEGFLLDHKKSHLTEINLKHKSGINLLSKISIDKNAYIFEQNIRMSDYEALQFDHYYEGDEDAIKSALAKNNEGEINSFSHISDEEIFKIDLKFTLLEVFDTISTITFVTPLQFKKFENNPFQQEHRAFPIDFNHLFADRYSIVLQLPEGYAFDHKPDNLNVSMQEKEVSFSYKSEQNDKKLTLNILFAINNKIIMPSKYEELKTIFDLIINKLNEPIAIKKI